MHKHFGVLGFQGFTTKRQHKAQDPSRSQTLDSANPGSRIFMGPWHKSAPSHTHTVTHTHSKLTSCSGTRFWPVCQSGSVWRLTPSCPAHSGTSVAQSSSRASAAGGRWRPSSPSATSCCRLRSASRRPRSPSPPPSLRQVSTDTTAQSVTWDTYRVSHNLPIFDVSHLARPF